MQLAVDRVGSEQGLAAIEHALNRQLNDRLSAREAQGDRPMPLLLVCECGRSDCAETIVVSPTEYAAAQSCEHLYLVAPEHQSPGVTNVIAEAERRFSMVELLPSAAAAAARLEPEAFGGRGRDRTEDRLRRPRMLCALDHRASRYRTTDARVLRRNQDAATPTKA
jgi:hypothetical protein